MQGPQAQAPTQRQLQAQAQMRAETHSLRGELSVKQLWAHLYALTLNGTLTLPQFCAQARCVCRPYASYTPTNAPTSTYAPISTSAFTPTTRYSSPHTPVLEIDLVNYETLSADAVKLGRAFHALLQSRQQEDASLLPPLLDDLKAFFKALMDEK
ncbi:hypothetical protein B484DRAFT_195310 [Ochromonadaceae sp. CCMP2298]|nr:hypothetical protein B484DRAFT_195310 [Ochromonadaceae sp. CCMP2298]